MNCVRVLLIAAILFGMAAFGFGQDAGQQPGSATQQERQHPPEAVNPPGAQTPQERPQKPEKQEVPQTPKTQPKTSQEEQHRSAQEGKVSPNTKSVRIPDPQFRAHFGRQHTFTINRVVTETTIVPRQTQFIVAGYTFVFLDPWPVGWLLTDDCYIDFIEEEYFLFDVLHPGVRVALLVIE